MTAIFYYHPGKMDILDIRDNVYYEARKAVSRLSGDKEGQMLLERRLNEVFDNVMTHYRLDFPDREEADYHFVSFVFASGAGPYCCRLLCPKIRLENRRLRGGRWPSKHRSNRHRCAELCLVCDRLRIEEQRIRTGFLTGRPVPLIITLQFFLLIKW